MERLAVRLEVDCGFIQGLDLLRVGHGLVNFRRRIIRNLQLVRARAAHHHQVQGGYRGQSNQNSSWFHGGYSASRAVSLRCYLPAGTSRISFTDVPTLGSF